MRFLCFAIAVCAVAASAWFASPSIAAPPAPCSAPQFRQFDFWVGDWTVTQRGTGKLAGTNNVTKEYGNCVVMEHWAGARGSRGSSFNIYDPARRRWHQTWVDNQGTLLLLDGGMRSGSMVLQGDTSGTDGKKTINRITWTPFRNGTVRQHWTVSTDNGKTWTDAFDGIYTRKK